MMNNIENGIELYVEKCLEDDDYACFTEEEVREIVTDLWDDLQEFLN